MKDSNLLKKMVTSLFALPFIVTSGNSQFLCIISRFWTVLWALFIPNVEFFCLEKMTGLKVPFFSLVQVFGVRQTGSSKTRSSSNLKLLLFLMSSFATTSSITVNFLCQIMYICVTISQYLKGHSLWGEAMKKCQIRAFESKRSANWSLTKAVLEQSLRR